MDDFDFPVHERLRRARVAKRDDIASIAHRIGVSERLLLAIEEGRFQDLPAGLYGRAAVRRYSAALGLEADEVLALCDPLLRMPEDPMSGLARLHGMAGRPAAARPVAAEPDDPPLPAVAAWRLAAAVVIDAAVVVALLLVAITATLTVSVGPPSALGRSAAPVFGVLGVVLGSCYFLFFGGIACRTPGDHLAGLSSPVRETCRVDLRAIAAGTLRCAFRDLALITRLGRLAGSFPLHYHHPPGGQEQQRAHQQV